ncbi:unnamed protein product, partial [Rhizoctonia solani]
MHEVLISKRIVSKQRDCRMDKSCPGMACRQRAFVWDGWVKTHRSTASPYLDALSATFWHWFGKPHARSVMTGTPSPRTCNGIVPELPRHISKANRNMNFNAFRPGGSIGLIGRLIGWWNNTTVVRITAEDQSSPARSHVSMIPKTTPARSVFAIHPISQTSSLAIGSNPISSRPQK